MYWNRSQWKLLEDTILSLLTKLGSGLKVWSVACSTGEEPYSPVTLLSIYKPSRLSTLATNLKQAILNQAEVGIYAEKALKELTREEKDEFFIKSGSSYQFAWRSLSV